MLAKLSPFAGINKDLSVNDLPLGVVTDAGNVRFREGCAELFLGQIDAYPTAPIAPVSAFPVRIGTGRYWVVLSQNKAYAVTGSPAVWTNITRQTSSADVDYAASLDTLWNGGILNGVPILNNGSDVPQMWSPVGPANKLQTLTAWPASTTARVLRTHRYTGFALDVTQGGTRYPHRVLWSHPADPGTVPVSWDVTDATKLAGQTDVQGAGYLVDALPLRQALVIYKENSTLLCTFVGGQSVYSFTEIFSSSGMLSADCAVEVEGSHVVLTSNDVVRHDGTTIQSILDKATRRWLFKNIDGAYYDRCFVTRNIYFNEVLVCFPQVGNTACNMALVYNYKDGTTSFRDLPAVTSGNTGLVDNSVENTIDGRTLPIDAYTNAIDEVEFGAQLERTMLCAPGRPALVLIDSGKQFFGVNISGFLQRTGISFDAPNQVKTVTRVRPRFFAPIGSVLVFRLGGHMDIYGDPVWSDPVTFTVGTDTSVDTYASGRFLAYRIESTLAYSWRLEGLDFEFTPRGGF